MATNAVSRKEDVEDDFAIQLSTHMSWEHLLSPAPLSIGLLGDLMIMSSEIKDFPIDGQLPQNGTIRYVKYPKSFRTTLVQISNDALRAFMMAHNNMDKIRLLMGQVPPYMKEATEILLKGNNAIIVNYLPAPMNRIKQAAKSSVDLSKQVVLQFEFVINLIFEVLEMCTNEKNVQEAKLETNFNRQSVLNKTIPLYEQMVSQLNKTITKDEEMMDRAEQDMRKALKDMPSGWEMIGMDFVQSLGNTLNTALLDASQIAVRAALGPAGISSMMLPKVLDFATAATSLLPNKKDRESPSQLGEEQQAPVAAGASSNEDRCTLQYKKYVFDLNGMARHFQTTYNNLKSIDSAKGKYNPKQDTSKLNDILSAVEQCDPLTELVNTGLNFVSSLEEIVNLKKSNNMTDEELTEIRQTSFKDAMEIVGKFTDISNNLKKWILSNQQPVAAKTPFLSSAQQQPKNVKGSASQQALANCKYRAEMAQATLFAVRESMEKTRDQMIEQNLEFIKLLGEKQSLKLDEIRYDEIIKVLEEGIKKLAILKEHWTNLVMFFQKISNFVENVANTQIEDFHSAAETTAKSKILDMFVFDMLYTKALKATQASSVVHNMAEIYMNVSTHYIMPSVSSLSKFVVTNRKTAAVERAKLLEQCSADAQAIVDLIVEEKGKVIEKLQKRMVTFKKEFSFLDEVRENQIKQIREKTELEVKRKVKPGTTPKQITVEVDKKVKLVVQNDEFLRENFILDESFVVGSGDF